MLGAVLLLAACFPFDYDGEKITGPYEIVAIDTDEATSLSYDLGDGGSIGRVSETVFAVGWNDKYIVAARHPHTFSQPTLDKTQTEYFYIIRSKDGPYVDPSVAVKGPYDEAAFAQEKGRLGLPPFRREIASLK